MGATMCFRWASAEAGLAHNCIEIPLAAQNRINVRDIGECAAANGYPTLNRTNCCYAGFTKFKIYPSESASHVVYGFNDAQVSPLQTKTAATQ